MSLRKRPLIEGRSGSFVKMLSINEALFVVINPLRPHFRLRAVLGLPLHNLTFEINKQNVIEKKTAY